MGRIQIDSYEDSSVMDPSGGVIVKKEGREKNESKG